MYTDTFCISYEILAALSGGLKEIADQRIEVSILAVFILFNGCHEARQTNDIQVDDDILTRLAC